MRKIINFMVIFLTISFFSFSEEFKVKITGYKISIDGEKKEEVHKILNSFPLSKGNTIEDVVKSIDRNFKIEKEFEFSFNTKDNVLTVVEPASEWGRIHLEIKLIPQLINDVIAEFNVVEYPKEWEERMKKIYGNKKIPDEVLEKNKKKEIERIMEIAKKEKWSKRMLQRVLEDMEKAYEELKSKKIGPKATYEGKGVIFKLGKINILKSSGVQQTERNGEIFTFSEIRTCLIEKK